MFRIVSLAVTSLLLAGLAARMDGKRGDRRLVRRFDRVRASY